MSATSSKSIQVQQSESLSQVQERLRQVALIGDSTQKPYAAAQISTKIVTPAAVWPLSRYVLSNHLETQRYLHWAFEQEHSIDTFHQEDDALRLVFKLEGEADEWALVPPIVEESPVDGKPLLVDGEHRFFLAREMGLPIRVIWISQVPQQYPVVATPVEWSEVKEFSEVPSLAEKREYRFPSLAAFPDITSFSNQKIDQNNFLYFFFRDLSPVCTSGVRRVGSS